MEKDFSDFGILFQHIVGSMKASYPMWEELAGRAFKLHTALRGTVAAITGFLETFQKLSDYAIQSRGATKDIGSSLTRLCFRHKTIENRLKALTNALLESLIMPLQDHIETWKKTVVQLDKDHARDYKKAQQSVKKASTDTIRLKKKVDKGKVDIRYQLDSAVEDLHTKHSLLEATEKNAVRMAMTEERSHFCILIKCLQPIMCILFQWAEYSVVVLKEQELAMLSEVTHLQEIVTTLYTLSQDPSSFPMSNEQSVYGAPQSTLERKKKELINSEALSDRSASSSTGSIQNSVDSYSSAGIMYGSQPPSMSDVQSASIQSSESNSSLQTPNFHGPTIDDIPLPFDRPHTISSSIYQHGHHLRPQLTGDTFEPPTPSSNSVASHRGYEHETAGNRNTIAVATPKVAEIYARPSLFIGKDSRIMPVAVATPIVPTLPTKVSAVSEEDLTIGEVKSVSSSSDRLPSFLDESSRQNSTMSSDMSALAEAIRDLEANTAALQLPFSELQAQSCQSLQCSSGYGTMTNISVGTACSHETVAAVATDFEGLAEALLEEHLTTASKYRTLPTKRVTQPLKNERPPTANRPVSTTGLKANFKTNSVPTSQGSLSAETSDGGSSKLSSVNQTDENITSSGPTEIAGRTGVDWYVGDPLESHSEMFPPPPEQITQGGNDWDEGDDFPLPPPPDLDSIPTPSIGASNNSASASGPSLLMHSLSVKLAPRNSISGRAPPPVAAKTFRGSQMDSRSATVDLGDSTLTSPNENSLLAQIQRGKSLRRAVSNDRSAPHIPGKN